MKTLYLDLSMGAAGDMLTAALLELVPDPEAFVETLNAAGLPGVRYVREDAEKCGIRGTHVAVKIAGQEEKPAEDRYHHSEYRHRDEMEHEHKHHHHHHKRHKKSFFARLFGKKDKEESEHHHHHRHHHHHHHHTEPQRGLSEIEQIIRAQQGISDGVKDTAVAVYTRIAEAESHAHGVPVTEVHFHEVGTMDAIADVTAVCALMEAIAPDEVIASPVHVGTGVVQCAHGILPVPTPATAYLLKGVPVYTDGVQGELCTPTGAALVTQFVTKFGGMPPMKVDAVGHGMGTKNFARANCVRALIGEAADVAEGVEGYTYSAFEYDVTVAASLPDEPGVPTRPSGDRDDNPADDTADTVLELSCNVDDMTGEAIGFAAEQLWEAGALDVTTESIGMKKSRPGTCIRALCPVESRDAVVRCMLQHTTTIGVREQRLRRYVLDRKIETVQTAYGPVRRKIATGYGMTRRKWENDDLAEIARKTGKSRGEIEEELNRWLNNG